MLEIDIGGEAVAFAPNTNPVPAEDGILLIVWVENVVPKEKGAGVGIDVDEVVVTIDGVEAATETSLVVVGDEGKENNFELGADVGNAAGVVTGPPLAVVRKVPKLIGGMTGADVATVFGISALGFEGWGKGGLGPPKNGGNLYFSISSSGLDGDCFCFTTGGDGVDDGEGIGERDEVVTVAVVLVVDVVVRKPNPFLNASADNVDRNGDGGSELVVFGVVVLTTDEAVLVGLNPNLNVDRESPFETDVVGTDVLIPRSNVDSDLAVEAEVTFGVNPNLKVGSASVFEVVVEVTGLEVNPNLNVGCDSTDLESEAEGLTPNIILGSDLELNFLEVSDEAL